MLTASYYDINGGPCLVDSTERHLMMTSNIIDVIEIVEPGTHAGVLILTFNIDSKTF